jgi:effector-binding domain-containing protein
MNINIILLTLKIIILIIIIIFLIFSLINSNKKNIETFNNANPTLNKCIIYKTTIDNIIQEKTKDFLNAEIAVKNANKTLEEANIASKSDPKYNENLQNAKAALDSAIYNRDCKAIGMDVINSVNNKLDELMELDKNLIVEQAPRIQCNYLINEILNSLSHVETTYDKLFKLSNSKISDIANKNREVTITSPSSPQYEKLVKELNEFQESYNKVNKYKICYENNALTIYNNIKKSISSLLVNNPVPVAQQYEDDEPGTAAPDSKNAGGVLTADEMRKKGNAGIANVMDMQ